MSKVDRQLVVRGRRYDVEYALCADRSMPARDFIHALKDGMWEPDPDADRLPADEQIKDYHWFLNACAHLARNGTPAYTGQVNNLDDGVWEFKRHSKRLSWYDTPGDGTYEPKPRLRDRSRSEHASDEFWWFPDFDDHIRLGHAFPKLGQKAGDLNIRETLRVRREDLRHDKA